MIRASRGLTGGGGRGGVRLSRIKPEEPALGRIDGAQVADESLAHRARLFRQQLVDVPALTAERVEEHAPFVAFGVDGRFLDRPFSSSHRWRRRISSSSPYFHCRPEYGFAFRVLENRSVLPWRSRVTRKWLVVLCLMLGLLNTALADEQPGVPRTYRYLVGLADTPPESVPQVAEALSRQYGTRVLATWRHAVRGFWAEMPSATAAKMAKDRRVRSIQMDRPVTPSSYVEQPTNTVPGTAPFPTLHHLTRISHRIRQTEDPNYRYSLSPANDGSGITVYVIDSGVRADHQEFGGRVLDRGTGNNITATRLSRICNPLRPWTCMKVPSVPVPADSNPVTNPCDGADPGNAGHGTSVASLIAGQIVGVAKNATIIPVKVEGCATSGDRTHHRCDDDRRIRLGGLRPRYTWGGTGRGGQPQSSSLDRPMPGRFPLRRPGDDDRRNGRDRP